MSKALFVPKAGKYGSVGDCVASQLSPFFELIGKLASVSECSCSELLDLPLAGMEK